jgi:predicted nucleotidyltransferase
LIRLPEKMRRTLEKAVNGLKSKENVCGIGLFGSWSRNNATTSSDVDLFILDKNDFNYEFVERIAMGGLLIDLDHVPKKWVHSMIPPEVDQKLYEMQILYDRDWSLTNTKLMMSKSYGSTERIDIRTEAHIVDSDIYLSRATSAFSREDYRSAFLYATVALDSILKILFEIASEPFSNSHFMERLEVSAAKLEMHGLVNEYLDIARLKEVDAARAKEKLKLFKVIWDEIFATVRANSRGLESSYFKVKAELNYYLNPAFLQGATIRTVFLIDSGKAIEAWHYLNRILLSILENYVWLKFSIEKSRTDYATLMRSLESLETRNPRDYRQVLDFLNLGDIEKHDSALAIEKTRETMLKIRKNRKVLIKNHSMRS